MLKLLATVVSILALAEISNASPVAAPITRLEVGHTYVFQSTETYGFLMDESYTGNLGCSTKINEKCLWTIEPGSTDDAIAIRNAETGQFLFYTNYDGDAKSHYGSIDITIQVRDNNLNYSVGTGFVGTVGIKNLEDSCFLSVSRDEAYESLRCTMTTYFSEESQWYAYEANLNSDLLTETIALASGKIQYEIFSPRFIQQAVVVGLVPGSPNSDGLEIPDYITYDGVDYPVTSIQDYAFNNHSELKGNLIIGHNIKNIGGLAFGKCSGLSGPLSLPESVTLIGDFAFYSCTGFNESLLLPHKLEIIGLGAFYSCSNFTGSLILPNSVTSTGHYSFCFCRGFTGSLILPESLKSIGQKAFWDCSGIKGALYIPASVKNISNWAFDGTSFGNVICNSLTPPECGTQYMRKNELLVPSDAINAYKSANTWSDFNNIRSVVPISGVRFEDYWIHCSIGEQVKLKMIVTPSNADGAFSFISYSPSVATVDTEGVVTGLSEGQAVIGVFIGGHSSGVGIYVDVEDPTIAATALEFEGIIGNVGERVAIGAKVLPADVTDPTINWQSSNPEVAAVDQEGSVWFNAAGSATVTAECQGYEFSVPFVVKEVAANALNVFPVEAVGGVGHEFSLLALHEPENTTDKSVTWESSDPEVATVSEDGRVSLAALGSAKITARSGEHTAVCAGTV
ncbi:MAG: leucine-rich repeat protein, partial [Muribaculaceae bacterium]|nr:leucine-rich repeat protein [Muribaculaceae bacterium]